MVNGDPKTPPLPRDRNPTLVDTDEKEAPLMMEKDQVIAQKSTKQ